MSLLLYLYVHDAHRKCGVGITLLPMPTIFVKKHLYLTKVCRVFIRLPVKSFFRHEPDIKTQFCHSSISGQRKYSFAAMCHKMGRLNRLLQFGCFTAQEMVLKAAGGGGASFLMAAARSHCALV